MLPEIARRHLVVFVGLVALAAFVQPFAAKADVSKVSLGLSFPSVMGSAYQNVNRPVSYQAEAWLNNDWLGSHLQFHLSGSYQPYSVSRIQDSRLNLFGFFAGLSTHGGGGWLGVTPFFAFDVGLVHDSLSFGGVTNGTQNSATVLGFQAVPGVDIPLWRSLGAIIEFPLMTVFFKDTLAIWNGSFSLRWQL